MIKDEYIAIEENFIESIIEEIVSDLLYTLFQSMDEYVLTISENGSNGEDSIKMQFYIEKEMRKYAKAVYQVEVEKT